MVLLEYFSIANAKIFYHLHDLFNLLYFAFDRDALYLYLYGACSRAGMMNRCNLTLLGGLSNQAEYSFPTKTCIDNIRKLNGRKKYSNYV